MKKAFLLNILLLTSFVSLKGQTIISRNFFPDPFAEKDSTYSFFGNLMFNAEANRGFFSKEQALAWNAKYVGFVELYRWGNKGVLGGTLAHELIANPHNDINFNMRSAIWNESLAYFHNFSGGTASIGVRHHCKHEIDNTVPRDESIPRQSYTPTRRLIVLTSPYITFTSRSIELNEKLTARVMGMVNYYTYNWDGRRPEGNEYQSLFHLKASTVLSSKIIWHFHEQWNIFNKNWYNPAYFTQDQFLKNNGHFELGIQREGKSGKLEIFIAGEHYFDDFSRPAPHPNNVLYIGVRGMNKLYF